MRTDYGSSRDLCATCRMRFWAVLQGNRSDGFFFFFWLMDVERWRKKMERGIEKVSWGCVLMTAMRINDDATTNREEWGSALVPN